MRAVTPPAGPQESDLVRCIACRWVYSKPLLAESRTRAHDCPKCGYIGWLTVAIPIDPQPLRAAFERTQS